MVAFYSALSGEDDLAGDRPRLALPDADVAAALQKHGLPRGGYVVMAPGAEYGPAKRWPHFGALAAQLRQPVVLLGSGKEAQLCEAIRAQAPRQARNLAGQTSLMEAFALIAGAGHVVSNDSGLMHVAAAFGVPQAAVFGSTSPTHTPPLSRRARVVWLKDELQLDCMPCFDRTCRFGHTRCRVEVSPVRVEGALRAALAEPAA
jgi:heptosyltransferase-2